MIPAALAAALTIVAYVSLSAYLMRLFDKWEASWDRPPWSPYEAMRQDMNIAAVFTSIGDALTLAVVPIVDAVRQAFTDFAADLNRSGPGGSSTACSPFAVAPRQGQPFAPDGPVGAPAATPSGAAVSNATVPSPGSHLGDVRGRRGEQEGGRS